MQVKSNQNIFDVCLSAYGTLEALGSLLSANNGLSLGANPQEGTPLNLVSGTGDKQVQRQWLTTPVPNSRVDIESTVVWILETGIWNGSGIWTATGIWKTV